MVTRSLERLTRWTYPDSQPERESVCQWQLWHNTDEGKKYADVTVSLELTKDLPASFLGESSINCTSAKLTREDLEDALRMCICSTSNIPIE